MSEKSWKFLNENIRPVASLEEAAEIITDKKGIISFNWCGEDSCGTDLEEKIRVDILGVQKDGLGEKKCINCEKPAKHVTLLARSY
jgi:prolyl-tRNA synthetase